MQTVAERPAATDHVEPSSLDRQLDLSRLPVQWFVWGLLFVAMLATRLIGRTNWPLSRAESSVAHDAWMLVRGADVSASADVQPFLVQATALMFFLFGDTDYTARLLPLIAGVGVVATLFWLRRWIGHLPAFATAVVWTLSPVMTMGSLRLDGGGVLVLSSLLILGTVFVMAVEPGPGKPVLLGLALAIAVTAHPLGWLVALFTLIPAIVLIRLPRLTGYLWHCTIGFTAPLILISTWFLTRPTGLPGFFSQSLEALWDNHLAALGSEWPLTVLLLIVDEPLTIALAMIGIVLAFVRTGWTPTAQPPLVISCAVWAVFMLTLGIMVDGKGPAVFAATVFPLTLVAGMGLSIILDGIRSIQSERLRAATWALIVIGLIIAIARLGGLLLQGPGENSATWMLSAAALGFLIVVPLGYAAYRLTPRAGEHMLATTLLAFVVLLSIIALRSTVTLTSTDQDRSGEILLAGGATPAVTEIQARVERFSRDVTTYEQDARDPVGGHGLVLAFDEEMSDTFQWYFREFPHQQVLGDPQDLADVQEPDMIFISRPNRDAFLSAVDGYQSRSTPVRYELSMDDGRADYLDLLAAVVNPVRYRELADFILRRDSANLLEYEHMTMMVRENHAEPFWGSLPE